MQRLEFSQFDLSQEVKQLELDIRELEKCLPKLVKEEKRQRQQVGVVGACACEHACARMLDSDSRVCDSIV